MSEFKQKKKVNICVGLIQSMTVSGYLSYTIALNSLIYLINFFTIYFFIIANIISYQKETDNILL